MSFHVLARRIALGLAVSGLATLSAQAAETTLTDVLGRKVEVNLPAERVVLGLYFTDYIAVGGTESFDKVVGLSREAWEGWTPTNWTLFKTAMPQIETIADVGEFEVGTFSVEKTLSLNPDVVVLADWQYQALGSDEDRLNEAGVDIVVVDYNAEDPARHAKSTELLGRITGRTDRAAELSALYQGTVDMVSERLAKAGLPKPRVYVEFANKGPEEIGNSFGKSMWGALATLAGGDNIAAPVIDNWGPLSEEQILTAQPEVVVLAGRETELTKNPAALVMGVGIDRAEAQKRLAGYTARKGWAELPAVRDGRVHAVYQGASRTIADYAMIQVFAKALYPQVFADLDPEAAYRDFWKTYLPVAPEGSFALTLAK
ncbi:ABC transporter substrate-binding protein [Rhodobacter capsulatus]|uniref:ABC transporter substrate-binding protein n=1 Tax=Rhodobacter capsulatus TaxID=1061 RepID=UPI0040269E99